MWLWLLLALLVFLLVLEESINFFWYRYVYGPKQYPWLKRLSFWKKKKMKDQQKINLDQ